MELQDSSKLCCFKLYSLKGGTKFTSAIFGLQGFIGAIFSTDLASATHPYVEFIAIPFLLMTLIGAVTYIGVQKKKPGLLIPLKYSLLIQEILLWAAALLAILKHGDVARASKEPIGQVRIVLALFLVCCVLMAIGCRKMYHTVRDYHKLLSAPVLVEYNSVLE
ncbi:hypothetical protein L596_016905 [Steinernema carpocapsae]|uniref:Uncharacterized protein n=1 Tax=Steinernema carpocapsae TaxID=34508 RepID=A0A4U5NKI8_STECR|nr:hypothetical protein L596_016905 [Steinernema carpocapsae]